ncbi:MAG: hypothetical protein OEY19_11475 [Gammaproteobacteria bacterium]|nr:hypothetical protein [Gammaproteobacteria bacterium]
MHIILAIILIASVIYWLQFRTTADINSFEHDLIRRCFGDRNKAERLINHEMKRSPDLSRIDAVKRALDSIARDNR